MGIGWWEGHGFPGRSCVTLYRSLLHSITLALGATHWVWVPCIHAWDADGRAPGEVLCGARGVRRRTTFIELTKYFSVILFWRFLVNCLLHYIKGCHWCLFSCSVVMQTVKSQEAAFLIFVLERISFKNLLSVNYVTSFFIHKHMFSHFFSFLGQVSGSTP